MTSARVDAKSAATTDIGACQ